MLERLGIEHLRHLHQLPNSNRRFGLAYPMDDFPQTELYSLGFDVFYYLLGPRKTWS